MGSTTAYQCDGPKCNELTTREPNTRYPKQWTRVTVSDGEMTHTGSFHSPECAHAFMDEVLPTERLPVETKIGGTTTITDGHGGKTEANVKGSAIK